LKVKKRIKLQIMKAIKIINLISMATIALLGGYFSITLIGSSDLSANDKDIITVFLGSLTIIITLTVLAFLAYSTVNLFKGNVKPQAQLIATILFVLFTVVGDFFAAKFFLELKPLSQLVFVFCNVITIILVFCTFNIMKLRN